MEWYLENDFSQSINIFQIGIRPLVVELPKESENMIEGEKRVIDTKSISRKHVIEKSKSGIFGSKFQPH